MKAYTPDEDAEIIAEYLRLITDRETPEQKEAKAKALQEFRAKWVGRTFKCKVTGEIFTVPENAYYRDYYTFGQASLDLGDGYYARWGGSIIELGIVELGKEGDVE
jgi:hypothetical protein